MLSRNCGELTLYLFFMFKPDSKKTITDLPDLHKLKLVSLAEHLYVVTRPVPSPPSEHEHKVDTAQLVAAVQERGLDK